MKAIKNYFTTYPNRLRYVAALIGFLVAVGIFGSLADEVHEGDTLQFDKSALIFLREKVATPGLDSFFTVFTDLGGVLAICLIVTAVVLFMWRKRMFSRAAVLILSVGGVAIAVTVLKLLFARERPSDTGAIVDESTFSFPSGHAMGSMGLAAAIVLLLWPTKWRIPVLIVGVLYVVLIGFSRLYLGAHYPTDIIAGWLLGAGWVATVYTIFKSNRRFKI